MTDKKILEVDTVGSQDRPINEEDRKAFNDYFKKRKARRDQQGRVFTTQAKK